MAGRSYAVSKVGGVMTRTFALAIAVGAIVGGVGGYLFGLISLVVTIPVGAVIGYVAATIDNERGSK